jgi:hypothetical protein
MTAEVISAKLFFSEGASGADGIDLALDATETRAGVDRESRRLSRGCVALVLPR